MTEQNTSEKTQEQILGEFSSQLQEFMGQVVLMYNRMSELEHAVAYLLSKDPQWIENFNAAMQAEQENSAEQEKANEGSKSTLIQPE